MLDERLDTKLNQDNIGEDSGVLAACDAIEIVKNNLMQIEKFIHSQEDMLQKLHSKFPNFHAFSQKLEEISQVRESLFLSTKALIDLNNLLMEVAQTLEVQENCIAKMSNMVKEIEFLSKDLDAACEKNMITKRICEDKILGNREILLAENEDLELAKQENTQSNEGF